VFERLKPRAANSYKLRKSAKHFQKIRKFRSHFCCFLY